MIHTLAWEDDIGIDYGISGGTSAEIVDALLPKLLPGGVSTQTRDEIVTFVDQLAGDPDSMRIKDAAAMILSTPGFMRH